MIPRTLCLLGAVQAKGYLNSLITTPFKGQLLQVEQLMDFKADDDGYALPRFDENGDLIEYPCDIDHLDQAGTDKGYQGGKCQFTDD